MKKIYILTGGTINVIRPHLALSAPAYGKIGNDIFNEMIANSSRYGINDKFNINQTEEDTAGFKYEPVLVPTTMAKWLVETRKLSHQLRYYDLLDKAGLRKLETNDDMSKLVDYLLTLPDTRCIIMAAAICDFEPSMLFEDTPDVDKFGNEYPRLKSVNYLSLEMKPSEKIVSKIRKTRKDVFLVNFKTTSDVGVDETYKQGLLSLKKNSANLVFANDIKQKVNMVITPEEFPYSGKDRRETIGLLCKILFKRLGGTFDDKTYIVNDQRAWPHKLLADGKIPQNWFDTMEYLMANGAFKPLPVTGKTSGHFGCRVTGEQFERITSERKIDHNTSFERGMITVWSYSDKQLCVGGAKPSVGEKTQELIYHTFGSKIDAIVHFHCPLRNDSDPAIPRREQLPFECGSRECAVNTATGMVEVEPGIYAVHLDNHGPNIAFGKDVDGDKIVEFINKHWDLSQKTGGIVK